MPEQNHILATDYVKTEWYVGKTLANYDALDGLFEHDVGKLVKGTHDPDDLTPISQLHQHLGCREKEREYATSQSTWRPIQWWYRDD